MGYSILLVEDNLDDAELARRAFAKSGYADSIRVATDGVDALDILLKEGLRPKLVLLDLKLPRLSGFEVLKRVRENRSTRRLPVVILTASKEGRDLDDAYDLGANSYVVKPIDFNRFVQAAQELGHYWLDVNEPPRASA